MNGTSVIFLLDSGSTATLITKHTLDQLGIESLSIRNRDIKVQGADARCRNIWKRTISNKARYRRN